MVSGPGTVASILGTFGTYFRERREPRREEREAVQILASAAALVTGDTEYSESCGTDAGSVSPTA